MCLVRTNPNRINHYFQAGQGCQFYETNKWKDTVLPRLDQQVSQGNWATLVLAKLAKGTLLWLQQRI